MDDLTILHSASGLLICKNTTVIPTDAVAVIAYLTVTVTGSGCIGPKRNHISRFSAEDHISTDQHIFIS